MRAKLAPRWRLALLGSVAVVLVMMAALLAFNAFENWQLRVDAAVAIEEMAGWAAEDARPPARTADYLLLDQNGYLLEDGEIRYADLDYELAAWLARTDWDLGTLYQARTPNATCFIEVFETGNTFWYGAWLAIYVDVTSQVELIATVNRVFVAIALFGSIAAGLAGWFAGKRIEESEAAQKRFFENMSHELKTPLAAIQGYAEGAMAGVVDPRYAWHAVQRESGRMSRLVGQILDLSRLEAGAITLHREPVTVADFVQDCLMPFEGMVRACDLDVQLELGPGEIQADPELFGHALENVLSNAVRHARSVVRVGYDGARLWVENDGDLPEPAEVARLFERFRTSSTGGAGIGLTLAREITELHGWPLTAELVDGPMLRMTFDLR